MSNDPFADPVPSPQHNRRASHDPLASSDHLERSGNRGSIPPPYLMSPTASGAPDHLSAGTGGTPTSQRNGEAPLFAHGRTLSSDPTALECGGGSVSSSANNRGSVVHDRTASSDPTADTRGSPAHTSDASGDFTTEAPKEKKAGWSLFKTKDEKELENVKTSQTDARKVISSEQEKEFKVIKDELSVEQEHHKTVIKKFKKLLEGCEDEYKKQYEVIKKERKTELSAMESERKTEQKKLK